LKNYWCLTPNRIIKIWIWPELTYDSVPLDWLLNCLSIFGVHCTCSLITRSMLHWQTTLTCCWMILGDVKIRRGIFQGDSLSPLLFVIALMPLSYLLRDTNRGYCLRCSSLKVNHLLYLDDIKLYAKSWNELDSHLTVSAFSKDICVSFGIEKCCVVSLHQGELVKFDNVILVSGVLICSLGAEESYRYLGIMECDSMQHQSIKQHLTREYRHRIRKILLT